MTSPVCSPFTSTTLYGDVKLYSDTTGAFTSQTVPVYDTHHQAIFNLDKSGGGQTLLNTDLYVQVNSSEDTEVENQGDSSVVTGKLIDYHVFKRNVGDGLAVSATSPVALGSSPFTALYVPSGHSLHRGICLYVSADE